MKFEVDTDDLLKWARFGNMVRPKTKKAISSALNTVTDNVVAVAAKMLAQETGLDEDDVRELIIVKEATPDDPTVYIDMSHVAPDPSSRDWDDQRNDANSPFAQGTLVKLVTQEDSKVCELCLEAASNSPYTIEEINSMNPWATGTGIDIVHKNCRCAVQPWTATRQLPVRVTEFGATAPPELFTMRELGDAVAGELEVVIKATSKEL